MNLNDQHYLFSYSTFDWIAFSNGNPRVVLHALNIYPYDLVISMLSYIRKLKTLIPTITWVTAKKLQNKSLQGHPTIFIIKEIHQPVHMCSLIDAFIVLYN